MDGDGLIVGLPIAHCPRESVLTLGKFNEALIRQGVEGGKAAANLLRNAILEHYAGLPEDVEVMAKVCANVTGLAKAMKRDGILDDGEDLRSFTLGFTQGKASFDFVDVGHGKERADSKIKGREGPTADKISLTLSQSAQDSIYEITTASKSFLVSRTMQAMLPSSIKS